MTDTEISPRLKVRLTARFMRERGMMNRFKHNITKGEHGRPNMEHYKKANGDIFIFLVNTLSEVYRNAYNPLFVAFIWEKTIEGGHFWNSVNTDLNEYIRQTARNIIHGEQTSQGSQDHR